MAGKRKSISNSTRFEIFKRDRFTCVYCGRTPPTITLQVDHVLPVAAGGSNDDVNLVTSCFECNNGKRDKVLPSRPTTVEFSIEERKERLAQIEEMNQFLVAERKAQEKLVDELGVYWCNALFAKGPEAGKYTFNPEQTRSVLLFMKRLSLEEIYHAMDVAIHKFSWSGRQDYKPFRYFCGVCWSKIREAEGTA